MKKRLHELSSFFAMSIDECHFSICACPDWKFLVVRELYQFTAISHFPLGHRLEKDFDNSIFPRALQVSFHHSCNHVTHRWLCAGLAHSCYQWVSLSPVIKSTWYFGDCCRGTTTPVSIDGRESDMAYHIDEEYWQHPPAPLGLYLHCLQCHWSIAIPWGKYNGAAHDWSSQLYERLKYCKTHSDVCG